MTTLQRWRMPIRFDYRNEPYTWTDLHVAPVEVGNVLVDGSDGWWKVTALRTTTLDPNPTLRKVLLRRWDLEAEREASDR